jgi:hypothetical protein
MPNHIADGSLNKIAKISGLLFLLSLLVPLLNWTLILSKFIVSNDAIATAQGILQNTFLFRINIVNEMIIAIVAIVLAGTLYILLKPVNKPLALLAAYLKLTEGILSAFIALGHWMALQVLLEQSLSKLTGSEQVQTLIGLFLNVHVSITAIPGVFLGMNLMIFFYLLFKSQFVPRVLAGFGFISYLLIFIYDLSMILLPYYSTVLIVQIIGWGPSIICEIMIGLWLLIKDIDIRSGKNHC